MAKMITTEECINSHTKLIRTFLDMAKDEINRKDPNLEYLEEWLLLIMKSTYTIRKLKKTQKQ